MDEYALIPRHEDGAKVATPEQLQMWLKQTEEWIGTIAAQNKFVSGTGLPCEDARVVRKQQSKLIVTDGPFGEIKEYVGGIIVIKAESVDEAVEFAKKFPALQVEGNSVEVRKIAKNDGIH